MPKPRDETNSPKRTKYNLRRRKKKSLEKKCHKDSDNDSDSSSDYDPKEDKMEDMSTREIQRFIQKLFPSKSGKKRLEQLEKLDKLIKNKDNEEEIENDGDDEPEDADEEEDMDEEEIQDIILFNDEGFPDDENDELDPAMREMLNNNMKFNIVFTVNDKNPMFDLDNEEFDYYEEETDDETEDDYDEDDNENDDDCEQEEEPEKINKKSSKKTSEKPNKKTSKKTNKKSSKKNNKKLEEKNADDITEEEWMELAMKQEKELRDKGLYYSTKYEKNETILFKLKGWKNFKKGKIVKVNHHKVRKKVTYNIKLDKQYTGKKLYKNILSNRIKKFEEEEEMDVMDELESLIKLKKNEGSEAMKEKFDELCKAKEKKEKEKQKKKDEEEKVKNCRKLRKLMNERRTNNDYKFFKDMNVESQRKILTKLKAVNDFSKIEKPYRISLLESDIPVEFKADAIKKINMLEFMDPGSGEYYKIKNWVDTFMRIPFGKHQNLPITIEDGPEKCQEFMEKAKETLDNAVYGLEDAKMQILQMVGQWISNPQSLGTAIAVKGPPGTGKTTLIKEGVSKILNRPFAFLALGGATDSSYLEGHSYTYEGSIWGKIVDILLNCKCMNPVIYFDELDKISDTPKGEEIVGILTHLTDTTQNDKFHDKYFSNIDFNLSRAMFIFSYNDENKVNPILKDRMYRINTGGYKNNQKCVIANKYLIPRIQKNINFEPDQIIIPDETKIYICDTLTDKEQGVRNLKRCLEIIYTKLNLYRLMKEGSKLFNNEETLKVKFPFTVTKDIVDKLIKTGEKNSPPFGMYL